MKTGEIEPHPLHNLDTEPEWIKKAAAEGKSIEKLTLGQYDRTKLERAMDWLISPAGPASDSDWSRISLSYALDAEAAWIEQRSKAALDLKFDSLVSFGTQPIQGLEDLANSELGSAGTGYSWVELTSPEALEREGALMRHCVGIYGDFVRLGKTRIFSLRDSHGLPHATVEFSGGCFKQLKTKGDNQSDTFSAMAARALIQKMLPELRSKGISPTCGPDFSKTGFGHSNILGFCDLSQPLDSTAQLLVKRWLDQIDTFAPDQDFSTPLKTMRVLGGKIQVLSQRYYPMKPCFHASITCCTTRSNVSKRPNTIFLAPFATNSNSRSSPMPFAAIAPRSGTIFGS